MDMIQVHASNADTISLVLEAKTERTLYEELERE